MNTVEVADPRWLTESCRLIYRKTRTARAATDPCTVQWDCTAQYSAVQIGAVQCSTLVHYSELQWGDKTEYLQDRDKSRVEREELMLVQ